MFYYITRLVTAVDNINLWIYYLPEFNDSLWITRIRKSQDRDVLDRITWTRPEVRLIIYSK